MSGWVPSLTDMKSVSDVVWSRGREVGKSKVESREGEERRRVNQEVRTRYEVRITSTEEGGAEKVIVEVTSG